MKILIIFLITFSSFIFGFEWKNSFGFGIEYNSLLYEFEESKENSFYYNFDFKGNFSLKKNFFYYNFFLLYPFSFSNKEKEPLKIGFGNFNYKNSFSIGGNKSFELSLFYNLKKAQKANIRVPVEEETFDFYGMDSQMDIFSNFKIKFGANFLKPKKYEIFQNKKIYSGFKYSKDLKENLKIFSDLVFSKYYFDKKILTIPKNPEGGLPIPELKEHKENLYSLDIGIEYISYYILKTMLFYQKRDASIEDFSNKSFGIESLFSLDLMENLNMVLAIRYEKRYLKKEYLFFEPNILTNIGTSYIYLNFKKNLNKKNSLSFTLGRFVHDAREDFFKTPSARYKISFSLIHIIGE